ncbi:uncharacterized protein LOC127537665 isoform X4 [Acanthochromis polyacanthus]|uniref:uncharacterized protein LOC127537665 isoform X2 n=1 Tax=Acanthochromis polyacanthus TaxID=80966 RepID=UPI002234AADF|nr:uncharacterized protein LOC127537665 isoform X2 [Acanthochromis polyacanthus]XP_051816513.1 uncharacterized protein LOC127537665 isoform X3 [Acanthochromis polyacanthus]XP_051816514.1 uncharacterized protein LOC127537665 isoform X4 [Acanthochromis polyacanthus]
MPRRGKRSQAQIDRRRKPNASELPDKPVDVPPCSHSVLNKVLVSTTTTLCADGAPVPKIGKATETLPSTDQHAAPSEDTTRSHGQRVESLQASHSQNDTRYRVFSRNRQCTCNALMFLAYQSEGCHFTRTTLNRVLAKGNTLYVKNKRQLIDNNKFRNHHLTVEEMPKRVKTDEHFYNVSRDDIRCGPIKIVPSSPERQQGLVPLATQLESLTAEVSLALIVIAPDCIAVFRDQYGRYGLFDSHSRDSTGLPSSNGKAIMMTFAALSDLADHLNALYGERHNSASYEFVPVYFHRDTDSELSQESTVNQGRNDVSENNIRVFQSDSRTAVSDKSEEYLQSSLAVPPTSKKVSKLSKAMRRKVMRRARQQQQQTSAKDKARSQGNRQKKEVTKGRDMPAVPRFSRKKLPHRRLDMQTTAIVCISCHQLDATMQNVTCKSGNNLSTDTGQILLFRADEKTT